MVTATPGSCVLCARPAMISDWSPIQEWLAVEGCPCNGFFVRAGLWSLRLPGMSESERGALAARVRDWRAEGREAWLSTTDGKLTSPIVIFPARPGGSL
jgi:hypothetical protein